MFTLSAVKLQGFYQMQNIIYLPLQYHTEHSLPKMVLCFTHATFSPPHFFLGTTYLFLIFAPPMPYNCNCHIACNFFRLSSFTEKYEFLSHLCLLVV